MEMSLLLEIKLSGRAFVQHVQSPRFNLYHTKRKRGREGGEREGEREGGREGREKKLTHKLLMSTPRAKTKTM